jgi:hypothetical protein
MDQGFIEASRTEQFVLDSDPNFPEHGRFVLEVDGGR